MRIWVPDASPWSPDVVPPGVLSELLAAPPEPVLEPVPEPDPGPAEALDDRPSTAMALPPTSSGALTGATTWVPEPAPPLPLVLTAVPPASVPEVRVALVDAFDAFDVDELPSTEMALPPRLTGTVTGATTCVPDARPRIPEVVAPADLSAVGDWAAAPIVALLVDDRPSTETALPCTDAGAVTGARIWLPPAMEWSPVVSALAAAAPSSSRPPAVRVP